MNVIKKIWPILIMIVFVFIYFQPEFEGKQIIGADSSQYKALAQAKKHYADKTGETYYWNPGIFSGTSSLYGAVSKLNVYYYFPKLKQLFLSRGAWTFFLCLFFSYLLGRRMKFSKLLTLGLSLAITLGLSNIVLYKVGHFSKIESLVFIPFIFYGLYMLLEQRKYFLGSGVLAISLGLNLYARHPQMTFYFFLMLIPYLVLVLIRAIKNKEFSYLGKIALFGSIAIIIAVGGNIDRIWNMKVHGDASMRGGKILTNTKNAENTVKKQSGLDYEYAMAWSNKTPDVIGTIIPGFAGGSSAETISPKSDLAKKYRLKQAPLYWGGLPFTESPMYFGIVAFFLMLLTIVTVRSVWVWGLFGGVIISILISYGSNLEGFQKLLFEYLPLYNKFRAPQSILNVTIYFIPVIAFIFLNKLKNKGQIETLKKPFLYTLAGTIVFLLFAMSILPSFYDMTSPNDQRYISQGLAQNDLLNARKSLLINDSLRAILFVGLTGVFIYLFINKKIKYKVMVGAIIILVSVDFLTINNRYYSHDQYKRVSEIERVLAPRSADQKILSVERNREDYRVLDLSINTFNTGDGSYFHNTIGGYSPVKFQRYQDIIDSCIVNFNQGVLGMLNTKYVITREGNVQGFPNNSIAWFVDSIITVETPEQEIAAIKTIDTKTTAVVLEKEFNNYINDFKPSPRGSDDFIKFGNYTPDKIDYQVKSSSEQFIVFSEIWMDGETWKAYIDGKSVPFVRANYILRGIKVPKGEYSITFEFKPESHYVGGKIALFFGLLGIGFLAFGIWKERKKKEVKNS